MQLIIIIAEKRPMRALMANAEKYSYPQLLKEVEILPFHHWIK